MTTVLLKNGRENIYLCSVYLDITHTGTNFFPATLLALLKKCQLERKKVIIGMDSNAHSVLWGSDSNTRGEVIEDLMVSYGLALENRGFEPTFTGRGTQTHIDLTLSLNCSVHDWYVSDETTLSDHQLIRFNIVTPKTPPVCYPNLKKANWGKFTATLEAKPGASAEDTPEWLERECNSIIADIQEALAHSCLVIKIREKVIKDSFWTQELQELRREVRAAQRDARSGSPEDWESFLQVRGEFRRQLNKSKQTSWKQKIANAHSPKELAKLFKSVQQKENSDIEMLKGCEEDPQKALELLMDTHFPGCNTEDPSPRNQLSVSQEYPPADLDFVTVERVTWSINSFKPNKAAGPDGIKPLVLQQLGPNMLSRLTQFYRTSFRIGYVPTMLCTSKVVFIPKPGKETYRVPKSFRPISLSNCLFKVMERLVLNELECTHGSTLLSDNQHAFRKGSSCESALSDMVDNIEKSVLRGEIAVGVFLDIAGAFDNVSLDSAGKGMARVNVPPLITTWYKDYLYHRVARADLRGCSVEVNLNRGTPQGGVLSPLLWNIVFDEMLQMFQEGPVHAIGYADDGSLVVCGKDPHTIVSILQTAINKVVHWGNNNGLQFSPTKTVAIIFGANKKVLKSFPTLTIEGHQIDYSPSVKYLGVTIDSNLKFTEHVKNKCKRATRMFMAARSLIGKLVGLSPLATKWIFDAILRPILLYGAGVWAHRIPKNFRPLIRLHRLILMGMGHFLPSTPTLGLQIMLGFPPLDLLAKEEAAKAFLRVSGRSHTRWDGIGHGSKRGHVFLSKTEWGDLDRIPAVYIWKDRPSLDVDSLTDGSPYVEEGIICYTDGSKMAKEEISTGPNEVRIETPKPPRVPILPHTELEMSDTGFGFLISRPDRPMLKQWGNLGQTASVFQAEVFAVQKAAEMVAELDLTPEIHFYIDSQAAILAITSVECTSKTVLNCIQAIQSLVRAGSKVIIHWVKAHDGNLLNEEVDRLAKFGTTSHWTYQVPTSWSYIKSSLRTEVLKSWYKQWQNEKSCRQTKLFLPCYNPKFSKSLWKLDRHTLSKLVQFVTGHNYLSYHLKNISKVSNNACRKCNEAVESSWHLLTECPAFANARLMQFFECEKFELPTLEKLQFMVMHTDIWSMLEHPEARTRWNNNRFPHGEEGQARDSSQLETRDSFEDLQIPQRNLPEERNENEL